LWCQFLWKVARCEELRILTGLFDKTSHMTKKYTIERIEFPVIGITHSCFKEKFGIPRQSGLVPEAQARIDIVEPYNNPAAFDGLEMSSHIWLQFVFHQSLKHEWRPKVRPPRLGGNKSLGVFATRSPVRPANLGMSVVRLERISFERGVQLFVSGADLLDATPIIDIKPYVPYADSVIEATNTLADRAPALLKVVLSTEVNSAIQSQPSPEALKALIEQVLQQDPRPQYQKTDSERCYGMRLLEFNLRWRYHPSAAGDEIEVLSLERQ